MLLPRVFRTVSRPLLNFSNQKFIYTSHQLHCDEETKSKQAARDSKQQAGTIFDKIISKEIPADIIYEDDKCLAFNDIAPKAPVHFLVLPKVRLDMLENANEGHSEILGHLTRVAGQLAKQRAPSGFRLVINNGPDGCQSVYHLHIHILGGRQMKWPPG